MDDIYRAECSISSREGRVKGIVDISSNEYTRISLDQFAHVLLANILWHILEHIAVLVSNLKLECGQGLDQRILGVEDGRHIASASTSHHAICELVGVFDCLALAHPVGDVFEILGTPDGLGCETVYHFHQDANLFGSLVPICLVQIFCLPQAVGQEVGLLDHKNLVKETRTQKDLPIATHTDAVRIVIDALTDKEIGVIADMSEIEAVGHRIVHGGYYFSESMLLTEEVLEKLKLCYDYAPLHTGAHIQGIQGCLAVMANVPQVLVFDTAFHQTMAPEAYMYGLSYDMYEKHGIRRYGAHGTSHRYVAGEMIKLLGGKAEGTKIVTCHIGNGSSISAVKDGKVMDTTMGFMTAPWLHCVPNQYYGLLNDAFVFGNAKKDIYGEG